MNQMPDSVWSRRVEVGRTPDGQRLILNARLAPVQSAVKLTIDLQPVPEGALELSITGDVYERQRGRWEDVGGGQCLDTLREVAQPVLGWTLDELAEVADLWDAWHLNGLRAGCAHQIAEGWNKRPIDPERPLRDYGQFVGTASTWNMLAWVHPEEHPGGLLTKKCPTCGYPYGSSWLFEPLPGYVVARIKALFDAHPAASAGSPA